MITQVFSSYYSRIRYDLAACQGRPAVITLPWPEKWLMRDREFGRVEDLLLNLIDDTRFCLQMATGLPEVVAGLKANGHGTFDGVRYHVDCGAVHAVLSQNLSWKLAPAVFAASFCLRLVAALDEREVGELVIMLPDTSSKFFGFDLEAPIEPSKGNGVEMDREPASLLDSGDSNGQAFFSALVSGASRGDTLNAPAFFRRVVAQVRLAREGKDHKIADQYIAESLRQ